MFRHPEIIERPVFHQEDLAKRILLGLAGKEGETAFEENICRLTDHTVIRFVNLEEIGIPREDLLTKKDHSSHLREGDTNIFLVPHDVTPTEFIKLIGKIEEVIPDRPEEPSLLETLSTKLLNVEALSTHFSSELESYFPSEGLVPNEENRRTLEFLGLTVSDFLGEFSSDIHKLAELAAQKPLEKAELAPDQIKRSFKEFNLDPNLAVNRIVRLQKLMNRRPEDSERIARHYANTLTNYLTDSMHDWLKGQLEERVALALSKKGSDVLLTNLRPSEIYQPIRYPYMKHFDQYRATPEELKTYIQETLDVSERFYDELDETVRPLREQIDSYYDYQSVYADYRGNVYDQNQIRIYLEQKLRTAWDKGDLETAEIIAAEIDFIPSLNNESKLSKYQNNYPALRTNFEQSLQTFERQFKSFGFWPRPGNYEQDPLGSSPSAITQTGEMDCVGRTFVAYEYLKRLGVHDQDIVSVNTGGHTCLFVKGPDHNFYLIDFYAVGDYEFSMPNMALFKLQSEYGSEKEFNKKWNGIFENPELAGQEYKTTDALVDGLLYQTTLGQPVYQGRNIEMNHGIKSTTEALIYHEIRVLIGRIQRQKMYREWGQPERITWQEVNEEDIQALIDLLQNMAPNNPFFKTLEVSRPED